MLMDAIKEKYDVDDKVISSGSFGRIYKIREKKSIMNIFLKN